MRKSFVLFMAFASFVLVFAGCSQEKPESEDVNAEAEEQEAQPEKGLEEVEKDSAEEENEEPEDEEKDDQDSDIDFDSMIKEMEEITEGEAEIIYENDKADEQDIEDVHISLDGYVLTELNDFHTDFEIPFDDNTDGGVLLAHYTMENDRDEDVYYTPYFDMSYTGYTRTRSNEKLLLPEDEQLNEKLGPSNDYELPKGESVAGFAAYALSPDELDDILKEGEVEIEVKAAAENYDSETYDYKPLIGEDSKFKVAISDEGADKVEESSKFYDDKATSDNMGDKTMIKEEDDLDETVSVRDSNIKLEGYQFTEFEPNEVEAPRFENFDEGIVLLTIKMDIENNESEDVGLNSLSSKLEVNNGKQYMLNENMLLDYTNDDIIKSGESGEWMQVYVLDKEQYDKLWKDKDFELTVGPLKGTDAKDISKGQRETIVLPD